MRQREIQDEVVDQFKMNDKDGFTSGGFLKDSAFESSTYWDTLFLSPQKWLQKKRDYDGVGKLWRVHDNLYDLTPYIEKHPGGSEWLSITQGTDITELFMSAHILNMNMVESVLKKHFVRAAETARKTPYTWKEDGFYMTLKKRIEPVLKKSGTSTGLKMKLYMDALVLAVIASAALGAITNSYLILILSGYILNLTTAAAHNFLHTKDNWRKYYHDMSTLPSHDFQIFHCLSHHVFPNTKLDWEHVSAEPFFMFAHIRNKSWFQRYAPAFYVHIPFAIGTIYFFAYKMFRIAFFRDHSFRPENLIPFAQILGLWAISPTFTYAFTSWLVVQASFSYWFIMIGYAATHHNTSCFHDGDHIRNNPDWGMCQMDATRDTRVDWSENMYVQATIYAEHPLHHMLPTVSLDKYKPLKSIFMDTMDEFGMKYPRYNRWEGLIDTFQNYAKVTPTYFGVTDAAKSANQ